MTRRYEIREHEGNDADCYVNHVAYAPSEMAAQEIADAMARQYPHFRYTVRPVL